MLANTKQKRILCKKCKRDLSHSVRWYTWYSCPTCKAWTNQVIIVKAEIA